MGLLIIVPLLVSGYMVCIRHPFFYHRLHRFQGQLLYLQVARLGLVCLIIATILSAIILALSKQKVEVAGYAIATDYSSYLGALLVQLDIANEKNGALWVFLLQIGLTAMAIPLGWAKLYVRLRKKVLKLETDEQLHYLLSLGVLDGNAFRRLLRESIEQREPCMFSLSDRKVYVGIVVFVGEPTESEGMDHAFTLLPILSGYRDKDTLEVTFNTHYTNTNQPLPIMLVQENVVSATRFDFTTWNTFQSRKNRKTRQGQFYQHRPARPVTASRACA
ncbi:hypothetical protein IMF22_13345 [Pseudomonas poae]|jgi:hypothetical protein|uniref:Uncharacterized protein n=1 Tax=Pseudomonas poae TaxID=200451 RepID=A0A7M1KNN2_9PSED|nr:hypothetical protein [Pseudomonas poae]QOQ77941.1 hypothetical protein IMF22_13345 [Pseudomonas poae]